MAMDVSNARVEQLKYNAGEERFWELESVGEKYRNTISPGGGNPAGRRLI